MKKLILISMVIASFAAFAGTGDRFAEDRMDDAQTEMVKQRLETIQREEEAPSSTAVGGSRSGQLEFEKREDIEQMRQEEDSEKVKKDEKEAHDLRKQKQLYEYDDQYRRGL